ncbi:hypothetical protein [Carboxylicivirga caseinilyticus]|uniref:hypothetical protein n=1 Tax=Carboxylicivirga caseinilyticus TaxID=3417572 RepID=UPI003D33980D|nr:hypothetical protein [Marinilabiliaceae bacterium A049]
MEEWRKIKQQPRINDLQRFKNNVLNQIESEEQVRKQHRIYWWRVAASIIVLLSVGSYTWMEIDTYLKRTSTVVFNNDISFESQDYQRCDYRIANLLKSLKEAGFVIDDQRNIIQFSELDVRNLNINNSPFASDVSQFLAGMKELYPLKYQKYKSGEMVEFNSWHLKKDQRLCDWVK